MNLGNKQPLKDFGQIQSCQNYLKIEDEKNLKQQKKLVFNKHFVASEEYCTVTRNVNDGYVCFYENGGGNYIYYFHLLLDSLIGRIMLDPNATTNGFKGQVTLKRLRDFPVIIPSNEVLNAGISLDLSIKTIIDIARKDNDEQFIESAKNLMEELRDDFVMELYIKDFFISHDITIVEPLVDIVKSCEGMHFHDIVIHIMRAITDPEGSLLSNMRRFRVLMSNFNPKSSL
jgi:hypothetical protein